MSTTVFETRELERLKQVLSLIDQRIEALSKVHTKGSEQLIDYRKYMWEDAAFFDRAERVQSENVALTQEQAVKDAALKLKRLKILASSPYFGRIDFHEKGVVDALMIYIGLHGLFGENEDILVYDWRAPISSMFYDYEVGPAEYEAPEGIISGDVLLKRQYKIDKGEMLYAFDSSVAISDQILRDALAQNTTDKMKQIVTSIQKEQNSVIRNEGRKVLIVQGPAGSGKTSIAMHRAAYLLYRHRGHLSANNLLIFSPNEVFADYISSVLPELGEENIREATFDDYARSVLGNKVTFETKADQMEFVLSHAKDNTYALRTMSIAFKSSVTFLRILKNYERHLARTNLRFRDIELNGILVVPGKTVEKLYWEHCVELPLFAGIERLKDRVLGKATYSSIVAERKIKKEVEKMLVLRDPVRLYRNLWKDPELVVKLAMDDPETDAPPQDMGWLRDICKFTFNSLHAEKRMCYEDIAPIILLKRLTEGEPRYVNVRHLIIDEAQDYTPVQFETIKELFGESSMTVLGDLSQQINSYSGIESYDSLVEVFGQDARDIVRLTKSYRSSWEITEFARNILPSADFAENVRRSGRKPRVVSTSDQEEIISMIASEIDELKEEGYKSIAIIGKNAEEAFKAYSRLMPIHDIHLVESKSIAFHHGLVALPIYLAKGLEFDAVIIYDAGDRIYNAQSERKLLYTACTRALHSLTVYYSGDPSPLLPVDKDELFERHARPRMNTDGHR